MACSAVLLHVEDDDAPAAGVVGDVETGGQPLPEVALCAGGALQVRDVAVDVDRVVRSVWYYIT